MLVGWTVADDSTAQDPYLSQQFFFSYSHSRGFGMATITYTSPDRDHVFEFTWDDIKDAVAEIIRMGTRDGVTLTQVTILHWQPMHAPRWVEE